MADVQPKRPSHKTFQPVPDEASGTMQLMVDLGSDGELEFLR